MNQNKKVDLALILNLKKYYSVICTACEADNTVICPRNVDAQCLICGEKFCGHHIIEHLEKEHQVSLTLDHCRMATKKGDAKCQT